MRPGTRPRRWLRVAGVALAAVLVGTGLSPVEATAAPQSRSTVQITVESVTPNTPTPSTTKRPLAFVLILTNTGSTTLSNVRITAERAEPVTTQSGLGGPGLSPPTDKIGEGLPITQTGKAVTTTIPALGSTQVTFSTTTSIQTDAGICLCAEAAVYPILFGAHVTSRGKDVLVGAGGTYLPVRYAAVHALQVGWVWPLLDRPHRLLSDTVFTDDALATEVAPGGRLDRALAVVEQVGEQVPLTLVVDPEIIDELAVMAAGSYRVQGTGTTTVPGTGTSAAADWLQRLHTVLTTDPDVTLAETPYADPDVQSLASHGRSWSSTMPTEMANRVRRALEGKTPTTSLAWPAATAIGSATLSSLVSHRADSVVLPSTGLSTSVAADKPAPGVVAVKSGRSSVPVLVTTPRLTDLVADAIGNGTDGVRAVPRLLAELTVRVTQSPDTTGQVLLTPPRYVDPDVAGAVQAIRATVSSSFTRSAAVSALTGTPPTATAKLVSPTPASSGLPHAVYQAIDALDNSGPTLRSLLTDPTPADDSVAADATADTLLSELPAATQRLESSGWRQDAVAPGIGRTYADQLATLVTQLGNGVHIVAPSSGSYTLASGNSALPVTVTNDLNYPVWVDVRLTAVNGLPGLTSKDIAGRRIDRHSKVILHIPTTVQRTGRIKVEAILTAPNGAQIGAPITLTVHSTALGKIGLIIMIVAGALLVLALARRWVRSATRRDRRPVVDAGGDVP